MKKVVKIMKVTTRARTRPIIRGDQNSPSAGCGDAVLLGLKVGYTHVPSEKEGEVPGEVPGDVAGFEEEVVGLGEV